MHVGRVLHDRARDLVQEHGLARARRGHDQPALAAPDGRDQVGDAHLERVVAGALEDQALVGVERRQLLEGCAAEHGLGVGAVDRRDRFQREVLLALAWQAQVAGDRHARAQAEALDL